jgi:Prophage minor tail protein Z (GPZ)
MTDISVNASTRKITAGAIPNPKDEIRAIVRAVNKTAMQARTQAVREVRIVGYNIKASTVRKAITLYRARGDDPVARLRARGLPIPLIEYGAKQTKGGVSVRVKSGRRTLRHAFIATMKSGHKGVFVREGKGHKRVTKKGRSYMSGLPIKELYGPSIPDSLSNEAVEKTLAKFIADKYPAILEHELAWLASKR